MNKYKKFLIELGSGRLGIDAHPALNGLINKKFPELFETKLEVGKWYKHSNKSFCCYTGGTSAYGFGSTSNWFDNEDGIMINANKWTPATDKEVEEMLIKEAKKRGFVSGVLVKSAYSNKEKVCSCDFILSGTGGLLDDVSGIQISYDGKWATIIEQPLEQTMEQVSEKYGREVKIVKK